MKFLLINPYHPVSEGPTPPLGLAYLGAALEAAGAEVRVLDFVVSPYDLSILRGALEDFSPDIAGVTSVTMTFDMAAGIVRDIRQIAPDIRTVMGGPHVTFLPKQTLEAIPELDFVVAGEGERAVVMLAQALGNGGNRHLPDNVYYRENGDIRTGPIENRPVDLDSLPLPARHLLPMGRYRAMNVAVNMTTSRGCPHACIFCVGRIMGGRKVRFRDTMKVVDELAWLSTLDFPQINIADDLFTANKKRCMAICEEILRRRLNIGWSCFARVDTVSPELLKMMKTAGCKAVSFGVESANETILKTIGKGITPAQVLEAVTMCGDAGMVPCASFILGLPGETPETLKQTAEFGRQLAELGVQYGFHHLAPFPGTAIREQQDRYDIRILTDDWSQYHANYAIVETRSVNADMLNNVAGGWEKDVLTHLGEIRKRIERGEAAEDERTQYANLRRLDIAHTLMMERAIEENGRFEMGETGETDTLENLGQRIGGISHFDADEICLALKYFAERGSIRATPENGWISWEWTD